MDFANLEKEFLYLLLLFSGVVAGAGQKCVLERLASCFPPLMFGKAETDVVHEVTVVDFECDSLF